MTLSKKLFGKSYGIMQWIETAVGIIAGGVTVYKTLSPSTALSVALDGGKVSSSVDWWNLLLGSVIIVLTISLIKERKRR
jgi:uncharacterized membrane protein YidH (DUF202 family)